MTALDLALILSPVWAYLLGTTLAAARFARHPAAAPAEQPPVSVLKPLHGAEPGLYENLRSFIEQDYPREQIVFGVRTPADGALPVAQRLIRDLPECDAALVVDARVGGSNLKVANLENMLPAARFDTLVLADSDMRVERSYLAAVTAPLQDRRTGIVTCLYKGAPTGGLWSALAALHINYGFLPNALIGEALGAGGGCFGATIALRRDVLQRAGGFSRLRNELADDYRIGAAVRELGLAVVLSPYLVETRVCEPSFASLWRHELRWARTVRAMAPFGFAGSVVTHAVPIAAITAAACGLGASACAILALSCALRWASAVAIARSLRLSTTSLWLLPVRDVLSLAVFVGSFCGRSVWWRDQFFKVEPGGRMTVDGDHAA